MDDILNVLIVEDEKPIREDLALFPWVECGAILIGEAANGREALESCGDVVPDVIVTDITMPHMDGLELMEQVQGRYPDTEFIVLTCHEDFEYAQKALRLGAVDYVTKFAMRDKDLKQAFDQARDRLHLKKRLKESVWREQYWDRTSRSRAFMGGNETVPGFIPLPSRLVATHYICQRTDAIFANRYCLSYLEREKEPVWFSPGGMRYIRLLPNEDESTVSSLVTGLIRDLQEQAEHAMPYLGGEVRFFGSFSPMMDSQEQLKAAVELLDVFRDHAFYEERQCKEDRNS